MQDCKVRLFGSTARGQSLVELTMGICVLVPLVIIVVDLVMLIIGSELNDNLCREAARIAATGDPAAATSRALATVLANDNRSSSIVNGFRLFDVKLFPNNIVAQTSSLQPYGGTVIGTVTVSTIANINTFAVKWLFNKGQAIAVSSTRTCPFTYVVPNTVEPTATTIAPSNNFNQPY